MYLHLQYFNLHRRYHRLLIFEVPTKEESYVIFDNYLR
jgi:hypothetical protein